MDIRKARQIAFDLDLGRAGLYSRAQISTAFLRLHRSQPEKRNVLIIRSDRKAAKAIWDNLSIYMEAAMTGETT